ncbi:MAG: hypothetical protein KDC66_17270 [Phaeodactylibacter sp.]|nr:hypothetical protein [Phaeodactylibacter sp.]MCB9274113.1 hypothetical protein [Lewinellaceae bacterium]
MMSCKTKLLTAVLFSLLASACISGPDEGSHYQVKLECQPISQDESLPQSAVYAIVNQSKVKIATVSTCDSIAFGDYATYQIPDSALAAVGGWWAGAGDYIYAIEEGGRLAFYRAYIDEMQEQGGYAYENIGTYENGHFNLQLPLRPEELAGTYTQSHEEGSHILFIGLKEDTVKAELFKMDGILPPINQLNLLMAALEPQPLDPFDLNINNMHFRCPLGEGEFARTDGSIVAIFRDEHFKGRPLRLEKILSEDYSPPVE